MKRLAIIISVYLVLVYFFSWLTKQAYIHVLICMLGIQLMLTLSSIGENEDELAELKASGSWLREWHVWVILASVLSAAAGLEYYYPVFEAFGATWP